MVAMSGLRLQEAEAKAIVSRMSSSSNYRSIFDLELTHRDLPQPARCSNCIL
jgi:hypothetical protein